VIKPGMDSRQVIARFESERQALAMMEHSNIAHVLDVGETEQGRPYFVMELVRGVPITEFCERQDTTIRDRLKLFTEVCLAVQHSHSKGIIHRDIKPSNVLVTLHDGQPVVKMIDFGVAKALNSQLTDRTLFTNHAQMIGTPLYMSPEQAEMSGLGVDTRTDIYALGVLLYELLTGSTPFDEERLKRVGFDEMRRIIREEEPPRPSMRVSTAGRDRETISDKRVLNLKRTGELLKGELDWIAIKALEKNRSRRYQTAQEFAEDIRRYLANEPVNACPPSNTYRLRKLLARHRSIAITAGIAGLLLVSATAISTAFAFEASRARQLMSDAKDSAELKASIANAISRFLRDDLLRSSLSAGADRSISLREALDKASVAIEGRYADQPLVEAEIRSTLGLAYNALGEQRAAMRHMDRVFQLQSSHLGELHRDTLKTMFHKGNILASYDRTSDLTLKERSARAAQQLEATLKLQREALGESDPDTLTTMGHLALCFSRSGRFADAQLMFDRANAGFTQATAPNDHRAMDCLEQTVAFLKAHGETEQAHKVQLTIDERRHRRSTKETDELQKAVEACREQVASRVRALGSRAPQTMEACIRLSETLLKCRRGEEAEEILLNVLRTQENDLGQEDELTVQTRRKLGCLYLELSQLDKSAEYFTSVLDQADVDATTIQSLKFIAETRKFQQRFSDAARLHGIIAETESRLYGSDDPRAVRSLRDEGATYALMHDMEQLQRVTTEILQCVGAEHPDAVFCQLALGAEYLSQGNLESAEEVFGAVFFRSTDTVDGDDPLTLVAGSKLAVVYQQLGKTVEAETLSRDMLKRVESAFGPVHVHTFIAVCQLASVCIDAMRLEEASDLCIRASGIQPQLVSQTHQKVSNLKTLAEVFEKLRLAGGADRAEYLNVANRLVNEARGAGETELVQTWSKMLDATFPE
ncbi:MAG: protein kinase, partial [Planctomycetaceae bacterium]|nr:protein kinase [Planctomycetaceae bacterium]